MRLSALCKFRNRKSGWSFPSLYSYLTVTIHFRNKRFGADISLMELCCSFIVASSGFKTKLACSDLMIAVGPKLVFGQTRRTRTLTQECFFPPAMCIPPSYADLGKAARDIFNKGFGKNCLKNFRLKVKMCKFGLLGEINNFFR